MHRRLSRASIALACSALAACGQPTEPSVDPITSLHSAVATVGCGDGVTNFDEECDGADDSACPGACSSQCACPATAPRPYLEVHAIDVGQGDGLLIWSPAGFVMVADSGYEGNEIVIKNYLTSLGITDVDYTVLSHMHADHLGALDKLLNEYPGVVACFDSGTNYSSVEYNEYNWTAGDRRVTVIPGDTIDMGAGVTVDVVHGDISSSNENNNAVVIRITHGDTTFLIGGDCETSCENDFDPGPIDVYKVHHHGSSNGSSDLLLSRMTPSAALISVGANNSFGHPHPETLDRLAAYGVTVYRTDTDGDLTVLSDGVDFAVNAPLDCSDGQTRSCGESNVGACQLGTQTCSGGTWGSCVGEVGPVPEDCGNGIDDDCDGSTDAADSDCSGPPPGPGHLLISQVHYDTPGTDSAEEFVDLYNPTGAAVSLDGWSLSDGAGTWTFPGGVTIQPGRFLSVARNAAGFLTLYGFDPDVTGMTLALNNTGDRLILRDGTAAEVDRVAWENYDPGWTITASTGNSIERIDVNVDTDVVDDWMITSPAAPRGGPSLCATNAECDDGVFCNGAEICDGVLGCIAGTPVSCDDGIACTIDTCNEAADHCDTTVDDTACDDGAWCNGAESCDALLGCQPGTPVGCNDGVGCTLDSCNEATDQCDNSPQDGACNDGTFCNGAELCDPALDCQAGAAACPGQLCDEPGSRCVDCFVDADCDNGLYCDGVESCQAGSCLAGTPIVCNDGIACTTDSCNEATDSCDATPDDGACDDGLWCNGSESCDALLGCQAGITVQCDDGVACTNDSCNEATDSCDSTPQNAICDDGVFCNGAESCDAQLGCQAGGGVCTGQLCDEPGSRCVDCFVDADCDDGLWCNGAESCDNLTGTCLAGSAPSCDDGVACTSDSCNEATDRCEAAPVDGACDDGLFCNGAETCDAQLGCQAGTAVQCDDGVACTTDSCNESTDSCDAAPVNAACDDGLFCNGAETCDAQLGCQGAPGACLGQLCDESGDRCVDCFADADCDDGLFCNGAETCNVGTGTCAAGTPPVCDDGVACTVDGCNEATDGCDNLPNNAFCDDGLWCNGAEICDFMDGCVSGIPVTCTAPTPVCDEGGQGCVECLSDADCGGATPRCDLGTNSCVGCLVDGDCDDGVFCNGAETCGAGSCIAGTAVDCSGLADDCNSGVCNEAASRCDPAPVPDGTTCDNGDGCAGDQCLAGTCDPASCGGPGYPLIAQVHYDTPGRDAAREFADLYNPTAFAIDLSGWTLRDNVGSWSFPNGTTIAAGAYLSVARSASGFRSYYGLDADVAGLSLALGNKGDRLALHAPNGNMIDHCAWEGVDGWSITAATGTSIERIDLSVDNDVESDFGLTTPATPRGGY